MKSTKGSPWAAFAAGVFALLLGADFATPVVAQGTKARVPDVHRSRHFTVHTDLSKREAKALLSRLEDQLVAMEKYWGRPLKGRVEFYIVDNLSHWPDEAFPDRFGRLVIARIGGGSTQIVEGEGSRRVVRVVVYASSRPGVAKHELVHAYCLQTFGVMGPMWYREGMAEIVNLGSDRDEGVRCPAEYVDFFRTAKRQTVEEVVESGQFTHAISRSLREIDAQRDSRQNDQATLLAWTEKDGAGVREARESYRRAWAFCHFMCHNPNYRSRFQTLGRSYLLRRADTFSRAFSPIARELHFEFEFFMDRFDVGYSVDRCHWDWAAEFHKLRNDRSLLSDVQADRGFQASGVEVVRGRRYRYLAAGKWRTNQRVGLSTADGSRAGKGRLVGVVMSRFTLSDEFGLGAAGAFTAPSTGKLYLRCRDEWNQIADNQGHVRVTIRHDK